MAGQTFCLLITHQWPDFHLLDPRPLPLGEQEENAAFGVIELRCWGWEGCPRPTWQRETKRYEHFAGVTGQKIGKCKGVDSCLVCGQTRKSLLVQRICSLVDNGQGNTRPDGDTERTSRAAPLSPAFIHLFTFRTEPRKPAAPRSWQQRPTEHRACVKPMWPHTEPGTFYTIKTGTLTKPLEITSAHVGHTPVVAVPKRWHRYPFHIRSFLTAHSSALFQSEKQRQTMHPRPQGGREGGREGIWIQMSRPDTD